jgi:hypothetical protein
MPRPLSDLTAVGVWEALELSARMPDVVRKSGRKFLVL